MNDTTTTTQHTVIVAEIRNLPCPLIDDPSFVYYESSKTDVTRTWRRFGWTPLSETQGATPT